MGEDIEILEDKLKLNATTKFDWFGEKEFKAIENLINRNKELEKENKELYEIKYVASTFTDRTMKQFSIGEFRYKVNWFKENYIPKSKVEEKIEELKIKIEDYKNMANTLTDRVDKRIICDQIEELKTTIKYLQELLKE